MSTPSQSTVGAQNNQDRHVTSQGILRVANRLEPDLIDHFEDHLKKLLDTVLSDSDLGIMGSRMIGPSYREVQEKSAGFLRDAIEAVEQLRSDMRVAAGNWRAAEDASTVQYV
ncbi:MULTISPECIES: hypothetical protein [unclassified Streptosporangium]|uniref:hypothetical protein n=1 Tax=unclassified Streptosporangium TaxID=2632669 RepID=UPI002E291E81|nr:MULTISPECIES: hypothetical protein [unclassified Streptosporangium]